MINTQSPRPLTNNAHFLNRYVIILIYEMSSADQRPYFIFENPEYNFEKFHIVIAICTVIGAILFILNIALGCCSRYSEYWNDAHTGKIHSVFA